MEKYINPEYSILSDLCIRPSTDNPVVRERVDKIITRVKEGGDAALRSLAEEIDGSAPSCLECKSDEFTFAENAVSDSVRKAIAQAAQNIESFHRAQLPETVEIETSLGVRCIQKAVPIQRVGLYIPGGTAPLFSTVLMLAIPAKVAQCKEVILCTPVSRQTTFTTNEKIDTYNETLRKMVFEYNSDKIFYVNAARYLKGDDNYLISDFSSGDGIHLAAQAYDYLLTYMLSMLEWI